MTNDNTSDLIEIAEKCGAQFINAKSLQKRDYGEIVFKDVSQLRAFIDAVNAQTNNEPIEHQAITEEIEVDVLPSANGMYQHHFYFEDRLAQTTELFILAHKSNNANSIETNSAPVEPVRWGIGNLDGTLNRFSAIYRTEVEAQNHIDSYDGALDAKPIPLFTAPPSQSVNEAYEKAAQICLDKKAHAEKHYGVAEGVGADMCYRAINALIDIKG